MRLMEQSAKIHGSNSVRLDDKGVIVLEIRGKQTKQAVEQLTAHVSDLAETRRRQEKRVLIYTDMSRLKLSDATPESRQAARKAMTVVKPDRAAIYGSGPLATFIMYAARAIGLGDKNRLFKSKRQAYTWLLHERDSRDLPRASLIAGLALIAIGASALMGWQFNNDHLTSWITSLRPINPLAAVGLIGAGVGTVCYWARNIRWLRAAGVGALALGTVALLPFHIDYLLFGGRVTAVGGHAEIADSAAVCFITMGIVGLIADRKGKWVHPLEYGLASILLGFALFNIFGQLYAHDLLYNSLGDNFVMAFNLATGFAIAGGALILSILYRQIGKNVVTSVTRAGWLIVIVLILVQVATYSMWSQAIARNEIASSSTFLRDAHVVEDALKDRFAAYTNALHGFEGLFLASNTVSQGEFQAYYNATDVSKQYPGLRALAFISKVSDQQLPAFVQERRTDDSLHPGGNPNFVISQQSPSATHYIVTYIATSTSSTLGTDLASNPSRVAAFKQAEAKNKPVASGSVDFMTPAGSKPERGFFISMPVAYGTSPNQIAGFVNAAFNYNNFFADTFTKGISQDDLAIRITDNYDNKVIYSVDNTSGQKIAHSYSVPIAVADRNWDLQMSAPASLGSTQSNTPALLLVGGQVFSLLLLIIFWIQTRARQRALDLADAITYDLQAERNRAVANDQKSRAILSSIGDGVFAVNTTGHITVFNAASESISGFAAQEAIGKPYQEILRFESQKTGRVNDRFIAHALAGRISTMDSQTLLIRKDGTRLPVADSAAPIRDAANEIIGAIIVFRDISKEAELDKAKTEFVSLASHQLRTPLSAINWYGEMLLDGDAGKLNKDQHEYIKEIFDGCQRMVELVNSLLDVSRLEVGKLVNKPQPTNVQELVSALRKELTVSIKSKGLTVEEDVADIPPVVADPKQLRMVVQNLMSNAVKYTAEKGLVAVTLRKATAQDKRAAHISSADNYWFFSVKDNGYGIPKEQQPKIFGKLFRADNVRKLDVEGTGLGLYIVKEVVEKMGGRVWFESTESVGTTFFVVAPMQTRHDSHDQHKDQGGE